MVIDRPPPVVLELEIKAQNICRILTGLIEQTIPSESERVGVLWIAHDHARTIAENLESLRDSPGETTIE